MILLIKCPNYNGELFPSLTTTVLSTLQKCRENSQLTEKSPCCRILRVWILLLCQLKRDGENSPPCLVGFPSLFIPLTCIFHSTFIPYFCVLPKQFLHPWSIPSCVFVVAQKVKFLCFHSCITVCRKLLQLLVQWNLRISKSKGDLSSSSYHSFIPYEKQLLPFGVTIKAHDFTKALRKFVLCFKPNPLHLEHEKNVLSQEIPECIYYQGIALSFSTSIKTKQVNIPNFPSIFKGAQDKLPSKLEAGYLTLLIFQRKRRICWRKTWNLKVFENLSSLLQGLSNTSFVEWLLHSRNY